MEETLKFVVDEERQKKIKELMAEGYQWRCLKCNTVYKEKRVSLLFCPVFNYYNFFIFFKDSSSTCA